MLRFIGKSTSTVVSECPLDADEITVGREAKCGLLLDSLVAPRMISRCHAKITRAQPASKASGDASTGPDRWLLTDCKSVNGIFVNDVKIQSTILNHNDVITFGGLGMKIAIGTVFPQPDAEFRFRFLQSAEEDANATLPMGSEVVDDPDKTQPQALASEEEHKEEEEAEKKAAVMKAPSKANAASEEENEASEKDGDEDDNASEAKASSIAASTAEDNEEAEEFPATLVVPADAGSEEVDEVAGPGASKAADDEFEPTQILPPEEPTPVTKKTSKGRKQASKEQPPPPPQTMRKTSSDMMEDVEPDAVVVHQTVIVTVPQSHGGAAAAGRTFSSAPTQLLPGEASSGSQMMDIAISQNSGVADLIPIVPQFAGPAVAAVSADPYALRAPQASLDAMSIDMSLQPLGTIDDSSQIAGISATLDIGLENLGMMTQTQVIRGDSISFPSRAASSASAASAVKLSPMTGSPDEALYDEEEESPAAAAAGGGRKSKKRDRASRGEEDNKEEEEDADTPKKAKLADGVSPRAVVRATRRK